MDPETGLPFITFSGRSEALISRVWAPTAKQSRGSLLRLRRRLGVSRAAVAAMMGASLESVRAWELGWRKPSGPAKRLIWLLDARLGRKTVGLLDFLTWGRANPSPYEPSKLVPLEFYREMLETAEANRSGEGATTAGA